MFVAIFAYIERIVNMVRPRKMLYMAVGTFILDMSGVNLCGHKDRMSIILIMRPCPL